MSLSIFLFVILWGYTIYVLQFKKVDYKAGDTKETKKFKKVTKYLWVAIVVALFFDGINFYFIFLAKNNFNERHADMLKTLRLEEQFDVYRCIFMLGPFGHFVCPYYGQYMDSLMRPTEENFNDRFDICLDDSPRGYWEEDDPEICYSALSELKSKPKKLQLRYYDFIKDQLTKVKDCKERSALISGIEDYSTLLNKAEELYYADCVDRGCWTSCSGLNRTYYSSWGDGEVEFKYNPVREASFELLSLELMKKDPSQNHINIIGMQKFKICSSFKNEKERKEGKEKVMEFIRKHAPKFEDTFPFHLFDEKDYPNYEGSNGVCDFD